MSRAYHAAYYTAHREEKNTYSARYYAEHREERAAHQAAYYVEHREERAIYNARQTAKKAGAAVNDLTVAQWSAALAYYGGACAYCEAPATQMDHVIAFSRGGDNTISNVVPACGPCNRVKHNRLVGEFMEATA